MRCSRASCITTLVPKPFRTRGFVRKLVTEMDDWAAYRRQLADAIEMLQ
jgi:hypothetical protein